MNQVNSKFICEYIRERNLSNSLSFKTHLRRLYIKLHLFKCSWLLKNFDMLLTILYLINSALIDLFSFFSSDKQDLETFLTSSQIFGESPIIIRFSSDVGEESMQNLAPVLFKLCNVLLFPSKPTFIRTLCYRGLHTYSNLALCSTKVCPILLKKWHPDIDTYFLKQLTLWGILILKWNLMRTLSLFFICIIGCGRKWMEAVGREGSKPFGSTFFFFFFCGPQLVLGLA